MLSKLKWNWYGFDELSVYQLYDLLKLRQDVFILEQTCFYSDLDNLDQHCKHLLATHQNQLMAYLRLIPSELNMTKNKSKNISLGRIITTADCRGTGIGNALVMQALKYCAQHYPNDKIQLSAQFHLHDFYQKLGFQSFGDAYDDEGIMHIDMLYQQ